MEHEDDFFDFDPEEFSEDDQREMDREFEERRRKLAEHPLNVQAYEILNMIEVLLDTSADESVKDMYGITLRESAQVIITKLSSGLNSTDYVLTMQKAALIRDHAEYLRLSNHMLDELDVFDKNYVKAFRDEMEKFRELFREWAEEIRRQSVEYEDDWALFVK